MTMNAAQAASQSASQQAAYEIVAAAFCYPAPGRLDALWQGQTALAPGPAHNAYVLFLEGLSRLSLGDWEELHTRTWDLNPPAAPYVGYQTWGESYPRGAFLAAMSRALAVAGIPTDGELPDHLAPVLRYLGAVAEPLPELAQHLGPALAHIEVGLRKADAGNPYLHLLAAVQALCQVIKTEEQ
jgi:nitrate reductase molybdenum cofactor assembly chaperone NarJ/NarW